MEVKSPILGTWKLFILVCFLGSLLFFSFFGKIQQNKRLIRGKAIILELTPPFVDLLDTQTTTINPTNFTLIHPNYIEPNNSSQIITTKSPNPSSLTVVSPKSELNITHKISKEKKQIQTSIVNKKECNIFDGRWVYKSEKNPQYHSKSCPFLETAVRCQENGRSDLDYVKWQWEAIDCQIPLFNGEDMVQRLRNKRMIIVGDSINRNMWESLACLIYTSLPSSRVVVDLKSGGHRTLKAQDYNFTLEFYMSPFLTELDRSHQSGRKVLILDKISSFSTQWIGADIMIFNSGNWWTHNDAIKVWDIFQYKGRLIENMPRDLAYKRGMRTWASWIKKNVDPMKSEVFFRSVSPSHSRRHSDQWCYNASKPMNNGDSYLINFPKYLVDVVESMITKMSKFNVKYLNITKLSQNRKDAHPSIFTMYMKTPNKQNDEYLPPNADCSHWCLPGLPDTWNRLLYTSILSSS